MVPKLKFDLRGGNQQMKVILFMPGKLEAQILPFMETVLKHTQPIFCCSIENLAMIYDESIPTLIVTTFYRNTNHVIHEKLLGIAGPHANIIVVHPTSVMKVTKNKIWWGRLKNAIGFFDDLYRPLRSIVLVGITVPEYLSMPINCEVGGCVFVQVIVRSYEHIKPGFIYRYGLKDRIELFGRFYEADKRNHFHLEPDSKLTIGNRVPFDKISRKKIDLYGRLISEIWRY